MKDPYKGALELPSPKPTVYGVEYVNVKLVSKPNIPCEKGASNMLCIVGKMVIVIIETMSLPEVVGVSLEVILVGEGGGGGTTLPPVVVGMGL